MAVAPTRLERPASAMTDARKRSRSAPLIVS
jgi:hypothetical protein